MQVREVMYIKAARCLLMVFLISSFTAPRSDPIALT